MAPASGKNGNDDESASQNIKILIAGVGALIPLAASLYVVDANQLSLNFTWIAFTFYVIKAVLLFGIGCLLGFVNRSETKLTNLLAVGLSVPSLLVGIVNGAQANKYSLQQAGTPPSAKLTIRNLFALPVVYASPAPDPAAKVFSAPPDSTKDQIFRGLGIIGEFRGYFVIAAAYPTQVDAEKAATLVRNKGFTPVIYAAPAGSSVFSVVIGEQMTLDAASRLQAAARRKGLPYAFSWRFAPNATPIPPTHIGECAPVTDVFSLNEKNIHQVSFEPTLYVYAKDVHDTLQRATIFVLTAQPGAYPAAGPVKSLETGDKSESLKRSDLAVEKTLDYTSPAGKIFRITLNKIDRGTGANVKADLTACLVI
jgi:hypothetical protein